ncbi:MAG: DUF1501 domain-containing protein [Armatimonadetes bacterium]|nr:DUF1501 domain-containing protein [Armatimonadota bacterium]
MLQAGLVGAAGLSLPQLLAAEASGGGSGRARARSVILLFNFGGPSHLESFDCKPEGSSEARGEYRPIPSSVPGTQVCELLPNMAKLAHEYAIIRSMTHPMGSHNSGGYTALSGFPPPRDEINLRDSPTLMPCYGSVINLFRPAAPQVPTAVTLPTLIRDATQTPGQHAGFLGKKHDPLVVMRNPNDADFAVPELSLPDSVTSDRLEDRRSLLRALDRQTQRLERSAAGRGIGVYHERAFSMLGSPQVKAAFSLNSEPTAVRDRYGRTQFGQSCLLARRLVEAGVRLVTVYYSHMSGGFIWDTHKDHFKTIKSTLLPTTDQAVPALLLDLKQRGLLEDTLVIWTGEFGRTPKVNRDAGRDHWPNCYSAVLAGAGVRGGAVYGASDRDGAYVASDPVSPANLSGTMYHLLGIDPKSLIHDGLSRPYHIADDPVLAIL